MALINSLLLEDWPTSSERVVWFFLPAESILFLDCQYQDFMPLFHGALGSIEH